MEHAAVGQNEAMIGKPTCQGIYVEFIELDSGEVVAENRTSIKEPPFKTISFEPSENEIPVVVLPLVEPKEGATLVAEHSQRPKQLSLARKHSPILLGKFSGCYDTRSFRCFQPACQLQLLEQCSHCKYIPYVSSPLRQLMTSPRDSEPETSPSSSGNSDCKSFESRRDKKQLGLSSGSKSSRNYLPESINSKRVRRYTSSSLEDKERHTESAEYQQRNLDWQLCTLLTDISDIITEQSGRFRKLRHRNDQDIAECNSQLSTKTGTRIFN